jgi:uncharacterized protein (TIGR03067 family)
MKPFGVSTVLVAALVAVGTVGAGDAAKKELERLQGTWKVLKLDKGGDPARADELQNWRTVITGDKFVMKTGKRDDEARLRLDPSKKPATIDLLNDKDKQHVVGIYKLEGDKLTLCFALDGKPQRPREFIAGRGSGNVLLILQREKK